MSILSSSQHVPKSRLDLLSLKKNRKKTPPKRKTDRGPSVIVLDDSIEEVRSFVSSRRGGQKEFSSSPILIDDSFVNSEDDNVFKSPLPYKSKESNFNSTPNSCVTPEMSKLQINSSPVTSRPSLNGWSPSQEIICTSPKVNLTPSQTTDIANESIEQCSIEQIHETHKDILDELYGDVWKSIPSLFKKKIVENKEIVTKKLDFEDSDKENDLFDEVRKLYTEESATKPKTNTGSKRKLFTEVECDTPEIRKLKKELLNFSFSEPKAKLPHDLVQKPKPQTERKRSEKKPKAPKELKKVRRALEADYVNSLDKLSFMGSLAENVPSWRCDAEALDLKRNFKAKRDELTRRLYREFNRLVFDNKLDADMAVTWDTKLRTTAGTARNLLLKTSAGYTRMSSIKLSVKVIDCAERLRDTLVHEMCHAATWLLDHSLREGHGPLWNKWARKALEVIPELGEISRCHDMEIHYKYSFKCTQCGYTVNRHSKSIDVTKKCCGYCRGRFEVIINRKTKDGVVRSAPARGANNEFARYVKENYAAVKQGRSHVEVMRLLGEQYSASKNKNKDELS